VLWRLIAYLMGYLRIEVRGAQVERFLNLALGRSIYLWRVERRPDGLRAFMALRDFFRLRPVAREVRCRVRIRGRYGFPFAAARLKRRPVWLLGALGCLTFLFWASSHIWVVTVKVTGPKSLDPRAVKAVAAEAGLRAGAYKGRLDISRIQQQIQERMGEISWVVIRIQGTRAVVEVVEKAALGGGGDGSRCVNLVARKPGVVEQVIPFWGEPVVKKGDIVQKGALLVECALKYWEGGRPAVLPGTEPPPRGAVARTLVAQAIIRARVTYHHYQEVPLVQESKTPTGQTYTRWVLNWKDRPILGRRGTIPFAHYQESRKTYSLGSWRIWHPPVELVILTAEEVVVRQERISVSRALELAREQMASRLRWMLGPSDKLLSPITAELVEQGPDFAGIRVAVETLEEIASPQEGTPRHSD
jgi:similar to stage IV sporulation protein